MVKLCSGIVHALRESPTVAIIDRAQQLQRKGSDVINSFWGAGIRISILRCIFRKLQYKQLKVSLHTMLIAKVQ